jgi:hypothetical protein
MQKREKTRSSTASLTSSPVISPRLRTAARRSMVQKSQGSCSRAASRLRLQAGRRCRRQIPLAAVEGHLQPLGVAVAAAAQQGRLQLRVAARR